MVFVYAYDGNLVSCYFLNFLLRPLRSGLIIIGLKLSNCELDQELSKSAAVELN